MTTTHNYSDAKANWLRANERNKAVLRRNTAHDWAEMWINGWGDPKIQKPRGEWTKEHLEDSIPVLRAILEKMEAALHGNRPKQWLPGMNVRVSHGWNADMVVGGVSVVKGVRRWGFGDIVMLDLEGDDYPAMNEYQVEWIPDED